MTTPLIFNTPELVIRAAMRQAKLLEKGSDPTSEDFAEQIGNLNGVIQFAATQGLKLFLWKDIPIVLTVAVPSYVITYAYPNAATNPLQKREAWYVTSSGNQYPLIEYSWQEWETLSTKSQPGTPTNVFIDKQATTFTLILWPVPDTTGALGTAHLLVRTRPPQMITLNEQIIFPTEWYLYLVWNLAAQLCQGQPQAVIARIDQMAATYKEALEGFDVEDAPTVLQVDPRMGYQTSRFS